MTRPSGLRKKRRRRTRRTTKDKKDKEDENAAPQQSNFHAQATTVAQGDPGFPAKYSGPNSLNSAGERQETLAADLFAGVRLWSGAEMHADALMWQGFGLSHTFGIEALSQRRRLQSRHRDSRLHARPLVCSSNLRPGRRTGGRARRPAHAWRANRTFRG